MPGMAFDPMLAVLTWLPGCVYPSMVTLPLRAVTAGRPLASWMVTGAAPGRLNAIRSLPARKSASSMAARKVHVLAASAQT